jgi:hypothetical protein
VGLANLVLHGRALGDGRAYVRMTHPDDPWVAAARGWAGEPPADAQCAHARLGLAHANWPADPPMQTREGPMPRLSQPSAFLLCGSAFEGRLSADLAIGRTKTSRCAGGSASTTSISSASCPSRRRTTPPEGASGASSASRTARSCAPTR